MLHLRSVLLAVLLTSAAPVWAEPPPAQIDLKQFQQATQIDNVIVPVPAEIFLVLDKIGTVNWKGEMRDIELKVGERHQIALLLGTVIADGFVAVEATDREKVKSIGRDVLKLAGAIGVRESVLGRSNSIIEKADQGDWMNVKREFDGALQDVRNAMSELNDEQLAHLVSLGGWLRGTEVLTSVLNKNYSKDGADLLHQPQLLAYFGSQIESMPPPLRKASLVDQIRRRLVEISPLIDGGEISKQSVDKVHTITSDLVKSILQKDA
ncbi:MAG TPA: hypothetical protein VF585_00925 [Chthoniobacterales bacterium]|jgi:hypothetical protein